MLKPKFIAPKINLDSFSCLYCGVCAHQKRYTAAKACNGQEEAPMLKWAASVCQHCRQMTVWFEQQIVIPRVPCVSPPEDDMPDDIKAEYKEAGDIVALSPRGASALLRLALQKLMIHLGEKGENLNVDIASLVKKGLRPDIQKALDVVRVVGNNAVHPGQFDIKDDKETATALFNVLNIVVDQMITHPRQIEMMYNKLPAPSVVAVQKRDGK
jgi:hypothetical protein